MELADMLDGSLESRSVLVTEQFTVSSPTGKSNDTYPHDSAQSHNTRYAKDKPSLRATPEVGLHTHDTEQRELTFSAGDRQEASTLPTHVMAFESNSPLSGEEGPPTPSGGLPSVRSLELIDMEPPAAVLQLHPINPAGPRAASPKVHPVSDNGDNPTPRLVLNPHSEAAQLPSDAESSGAPGMVQSTTHAPKLPARSVRSETPEAWRDKTASQAPCSASKGLNGIQRAAQGDSTVPQPEPSVSPVKAKEKELGWDEPQKERFGSSGAMKFGAAALTQATRASQLKKEHKEIEKETERHNMTRLKKLKDQDDKTPDFFDWKTKLINTSSKGMQNWDMLITLLLIWTAIATPYEVSFLEPSYNALFMLNRIVDCGFLLDTVFQFFIPSRSKKGLLLQKHSSIAVNYLKGWFSIDVISVIPFDMITIEANKNIGKGDSQMLRLTRMMRATKLVRMVSRLMRIARSSAIFKRWETKVSINYAMLNLYGLMTALGIWSHWSACIWGIIMDLEGASWQASFMWMDDDNLTPGAQYLACLHWSLGKVTGMGEGDALYTRTDVQRGSMLVLMISFGVANAYLIGGVVNIIDRMNQRMSHFFQSMDTLNEFLKKKKIGEGEVTINGHNMTGSEICESLRAYYIFKHTHGSLEETFLDLMTGCSPHMQTAIAMKLHQDRLIRVPYLSSASTQFITGLATKFSTTTLAKQELVFGASSNCSAMYWVDQGKVLVRASVKKGPEFFGEEIFYKGEQETRGYAAVALSECVLLIISKQHLEDAVTQHGDTKMKVRFKVLGLLLNAMYQTRRAAGMAVRWKDFHAGFELLSKHYPEESLLTPNNSVVYMWRHYINMLLDQQEKRAVEEQQAAEATNKPLSGIRKKSFKAMTSKLRKHGLRLAANSYFERMTAYVGKMDELKRQQDASMLRSAGRTPAPDEEPVTRSPWSATIGEFLCNTDLFGEETMERYQDTLEKKNMMTMELLKKVSPGDLVTIGIPLGHAVKIVLAIETLQGL